MQRTTCANSMPSEEPATTCRKIVRQHTFERLKSLDVEVQKNCPLEPKTSEFRAIRNRCREVATMDPNACRFGRIRSIVSLSVGLAVFLLGLLAPVARAEVKPGD